MPLPNKGSKYLVLTKEDSFGVEKWLEFVNNPISDPTTPPTSAVHFKDFISVDYNDGDFGDRAGSEPYTDSCVRGAINQEQIIHQEPSLKLEIGFRDLLFLLSTIQTVYTGSPEYSSGLLGEEVLIYEGTTREATSTSIYLGKYDDEEYNVTGALLNELEIDFGDDGIISVDYKGFSSKEKTGKLKPQSNLMPLISDTINGWWLNSIWMMDKNIDLDMTRVMEPGYMSQIGCTLTGVKFSLNNNMDADEGRNFCQKFKNISKGSLAMYMGELMKKTPEFTIECTNTQTTSRWLQEYFGGLGSVEFMKNKTYKLALVYINNHGEYAVMVFPGCTLQVKSPSLKCDSPEETLTFTAGSGNAKPPHLTNPLNSRMITYYSRGGDVTGIGFGHLSVTADNISALNGTVLVIRDADTGELRYLYEVKNIVELLIPLWDNDYCLYRIDASGSEAEIEKGTFSIDHLLNTEDEPLDLTACFSQSGTVTTPCPEPSSVKKEDDESVEDED
jgi:hypothetical protein